MADALLFTIEARRYAVPLRQVAEVVPAVSVHALPHAPAIVEGVVNVRGDILPVLSLRSRMGHPIRAVLPSEYFILVTAQARRVILRSDTVPELAVLPSMTGGDAGGDAVDRAITGVLPLAEGIALFHDIDQFMAADDRAAIDAALAGADSAS